MVSVILPVYNDQKNIKSAIDSVLNQDYSDFELIIIDDYSNDQTKSILDKYDDQKILVFRNAKNLGIAKSRNLGIEKSKGEYISFIDSDDIWFPNKLKVQMEFLKKRKLNFTYSGVTFIDSMNREIGEYVPKKAVSFQKLMKFNYVPTITIIYSKIHFKDLMFEDIRHEDYLFTLNLSKTKGFKGEGIPKKLAAYRINKSSTSFNKFKAVRWHWNILMKVEKNLLKRIYFIINYTLNGLIKYFIGYYNIISNK